MRACICVNRNLSSAKTQNECALNHQGDGSSAGKLFGEVTGVVLNIMCPACDWSQDRDLSVSLLQQISGVVFRPLIIFPLYLGSTSVIQSCLYFRILKITRNSSTRLFQIICGTFFLLDLG